jgi:hypothetical protein
MRRQPKIMLLALAALAAALLPAAAAQGAPPAKAAWLLTATALPSNFTPGVKGSIILGPEYLLHATNVGGAPTSGPVTLTDTLPSGLSVASAPGCTAVSQTLTCTFPGPVGPGEDLEVKIAIDIDPLASGSLLNQAQIEGGGAAPVSVQTTTPVSSSPVPFDFLPGFALPLTEADGAAATLAGSHPYQLSADLGFPTEKAIGLGGAGHLRDASIDFPPGEIINPAATPVLCTEAELTSEGFPGCPVASQVGTIDVITAGAASPEANTAQLYNMVPPPGQAASLAFDALGIGVFVHLTGGVRSDGDYGITGASADTLALTGHPVFGVRLQLWGDPSGESHDAIRGDCQDSSSLCPVARQKSALLTLPGECSGQPLISTAHADSWEQIGAFKSAAYQSSDLAGEPVSISGCNAVPFAPTISVAPTTNLTDSPSGLDVDLHQPQEPPHTEPLGGRASAALKDATVTLPAGMSVNPSQADGLGVCTTQQIGFAPSAGEIHFDKAPNTCPDAAKLGTLEVTTPLLAEYEEDGTKLATDPETGAPIPRPLHGSVYLAKPFDNPFGSLLALYLTVEDPQSGTVAKLAGEVIPDPVSGQLTTRFAENPQLPLEDIRLHLFPGARGPLITPPTCATHTTTSELVPWSSPEGLNANPQSSFDTAAAPGGGACPTTPAAAPNAPAFSAGTVSPQAGAYSPFVLKLSREDGSQRLTGIDTVLPPGLTGKLAGIAQCPEAQIAQAQARSHPNEGILERQGPSCPISSELGTVNVGAGAGPTPIHTQGHAYLAGPYKGAPLSLAIITPAIAGPFDLGAVVVRTALYVDPQSARIHAVSDPFPTILDGIPLDLRSVALRMDRPSFILNPTSCDRFAITGAATSALGQAAALSIPFQVGGCPALKFKPKLALKLSGPTKRSGNPALRAVLTMPSAGANVAKASVALPHSEFLDQSHIRTVCTRVQFAAAGGSGAGCPPGSVYGKARAITPLLDAPLEGPVFLRSNPEHELPDLVAALHGQIEVELIGRIDSAKGGIRTTFEGVPDAPVTKFVLEMQGGKKGLLENSLNLCKSTNRATALFDGQNGKVFDFKPVVKNSCRKGGGKKVKKPKHHGGHRGA